MDTRAVVIAVSYGVVVLVGTAIAIAVWRSTRWTGPEPDTERLAARERAWLWVVVAVLTSLLLATIWFTPYAESAGDGEKQVLRVTARQFSWQLDPATIRAGVPVELELRSEDVNHGFGVYDPDGTLVFQVQVMPGRLQKAVETFERPGTYRILCMEFCGVLHHGMVGSFEVR